MKRVWLLAVPLVMGILVGCGPPAAPPFSLKDHKGEVVTSMSLRRRVTLLYFWASWSPPSRSGLVQMSLLQRSFGKRGLAIVTVTVADDPVQTGHALKRVGTKLLVLAGDDGISRDYFPGGDLTLPLTLLLDGRGRVVGRFMGFHAAEDLGPAIDRALAKDDGKSFVAAAP